MALPTIQQLKSAIQIAEQIETLNSKLVAILGNSGLSGLSPALLSESSSTEALTPVKKGKGKKAAKKASGKRVLSAEAREKIAEAQRRRWSKDKK
jgi:hypothetical protein